MNLTFKVVQIDCYVCKEKFEVIFDEEEETWFFMGAKKIRVLHNNGKKGLLITVHTECLKQIEINRDILKQIREGSLDLTEDKEGKLDQAEDAV